MQASPIRIGYCLSLTGPLAGNGQSARLAHEIWREDVNRSGGLLGRSVELICYDDGTEASRVEGLYRRLLDDEQVDLIVGGYGTNTLRPAMPLVIDRRRFFVGLMGLGVNRDLAYPGYFAMIPTGPDPNAGLTEGFVAVAAAQSPRPATVALVTADAEFARNPLSGARVNAERYGFAIVHEQTYPLDRHGELHADPRCGGRVGLRPAVPLFLSRGLDRAGPRAPGASLSAEDGGRRHDWPPEHVGEDHARPVAQRRRQLGGTWAPVPSMATPGVQAMLEVYQARAAETGVDPLGHYMAPLAYAQMQVVAQAVEATRGLDDSALMAYARTATFQTMMGAVAFGSDGEWREARVLQVQFQGIVGHDARQFKEGARQAVVSPQDMASGALIYPYARAI